jgi:hypothetical protein
MNKLIELSSTEVGAGVRIGGLRQYQALYKGKHEAHGYNGDHGWQIQIEGALGEIATAKFLNIYWDSSVNTWKTEDLRGIQVRTRSKDYYDLIVRKDDPDEDIYVLVTGRYGKYIIRGWIEGSKAKNPQWIQPYGDRERAYFVPQKLLNPMETIPLKKIKA